MKKALTVTMNILMMLVCTLNLNACAASSSAETAIQSPVSMSLPENKGAENKEPEKAALESTMPENTASGSTNPETRSESTISQDPASQDISPEPAQWQVNITPTVPQPYIAILQQYEQFMNADEQNINEESVYAKFYGGEWKYLYDEICMAWKSALERKTPEEMENIFRYALADLTNDGFPEMIIAYEDMPEVIYHYSEANGIGMECASSYYNMTIYQNGIVEYVSGGAYSSTTYLRFQEDTQNWGIEDTIAVYGTWDAVNKRMNDTAYYTGEWNGAGELDTAITEEEYRQIQEKYVTEPMEFEWVPLAYSGT